MELLKKCELCERSGDNLSLLLANHKIFGWIKICNDCWSDLYEENNMVAGSSNSCKSSGPNSPCNSCSSYCH
jgi:hypothetical protein